MSQKGVVSAEQLLVAVTIGSALPPPLSEGVHRDLGAASLLSLKADMLYTIS